MAFVIVPCVTRQDVVVLSWYRFLPLPFSRLLYQTGRCSPQLEVDSCGKLTWRPLFLMMEYGESVSVRLILNLILTIWNRVLIPYPWKSMKDRGDLGRMKYGFPAETPVTPAAIGLSHAQWCEKIMNEPLPGDGQGRECFDPLPRFVVGDPSARFETHTPLTYETNGETGQPLWLPPHSQRMRLPDCLSHCLCHGGHPQPQST